MRGYASCGRYSEWMRWGTMPDSIENDERFVDHLAAAHGRLIDEHSSDPAGSSANVSSRELPDELAHELADAEDILQLLERVRIASAPETARAEFDETLAAPPTASDETVAPQQLGRFTIERELGHGGYGVVFLARDEELDRQVALKVPRPEAILTEEMQARFLREGKAAALLSHPNIVPVFETGHAGRVCFIVSRFVNGNSLADWIAGSPPCKPRAAAALVATLADAVQHAHSKGVIHRDLKPANILIEHIASGAPVGELPEPQRFKITDFGMAKLAAEDAALTGTGAVIGTPSYMSPEQARGRGNEVGERTDIWALGAILYELLTGRPPFVADSVVATLRQVQEQDPPPIGRLNPDVDRDLQAICLSCLEKAPASRYESAASLSADLRRFLDGLPVVARPVTPLRRFGKWWARNPAIATISAALLIALVSGLAAVTGLWRNASHHRALAESRANQVQLKATQLTAAISRLFTSIADSPEIQLSGAEPLRQRLLSDANDFYEQLVSERPKEPELIADLADTLNRLSRIRAYLGDFQGALAAGQGALDLLDTAAEAGPELRTPRINSHIVIARALGNLAEIEQLWPHATEALRLAREAADRSQSAADDRAMLARTLTQIAMMTADYGTQTEANQYNNEALEVWESLGPDNLTEEDQRLATSSYLSAAKGFAAAANGQRAGELLDTLIAQLSIMTAAEPTPPSLLRRLAEAHRIKGFTLDRNYQEAQQHFEAGIAIQSRLVAEHPLVPIFQCDQLTMRYSQMLSHYINRHYDRAIPGLRSNAEDARNLIEQFPNEEMAALRIEANSLALLGYAHLQLKQYEKQLETLIACRDLNERICELAGTPRSRLELAGAIAGIATCASKLGQSEEAIAQLDESNEILRTLLAEDPENGSALRYLENGCYEKAKVLFRLKRYEAALVCFDEAMPFPHAFPPKLMHGARAKWLLPLGRYDGAAEELAAFREFQPERLTNQALAAKAMLALLDAMLEFTTHDADAPQPQRDALYDATVEEAIVRLDTLARNAEAANRSDILPNLFPAAGKSTVLSIPEIADWMQRNSIPIGVD